MPARFDHLVIAVADLDEAVARWTGAGIPAARGGAHPVGTVNALVRGPGAAYLELIAAGRDESNPWLDRVRSASGPISWAVAVDDVDAARDVLLDAGFEPRPVTEGSRLTPDGDTVAWRMCDVGSGPYDAGLPFLIEWTTPMPPGPSDGPVVRHLALAPPDPDRVADLLLALGFAAQVLWPRRVFHDGDGVGLTLLPVGDPVETGGASWSMSWEESPEAPTTSVALGLPVSALAQHRLDDVAVMVVPDRRRYAASALLRDVDVAFARLRGDLADWPPPRPEGAAPLEEEYSRCEEPERYRLLGVRADAWVETIARTGLGTGAAVDPTEVTWVGEQHLRPRRVTVLQGRPGTQPVVVAWAPIDHADDAFVLVGVGEPAHVLDRQPDCGCDACDTGSVDLLATLDDAFLLALSGGVHVVREGERVVTRALDGWSASGTFADGEPERWLADAAAGRRATGVVQGEPWL
ncbi:DUF6226 family protein [Nocardioides terrigena]|uniref:DUF6226 family protein n=1 Tax=Nocardioides terrigena TaxID=424797 RepID=UPI000D3157FF|nr:DUF6226 family protein [Nocardioides terrigena]